MSPTASVRMLVSAAIVVALVGVVDAGIGGEWDLFVLFALVLGIGVGLAFMLESRRPAVPIRRDLVRWLRDRAAASGEPMSAVTDRAIATFADRYGVVAEVDEARQ